MVWNFILFKLLKYPLSPLVKVQPPKYTISGPLIFAEWLYLGAGGVPLTLNLDHIKLSVSKIPLIINKLKSLK